MKRKIVSIVCSRNLARSVFLMQYLKKNYPEFIFSSFGINAIEGERVPKHISDIAKTWGLDTSEHFARSLDIHQEEFFNSDFVISAVKLPNYIMKNDAIKNLRMEFLCDNRFPRRLHPSDPFSRKKIIFGFQKSKSTWSEVNLSKTIFLGDRLFKEYLDINSVYEVLGTLRSRGKNLRWVDSLLRIPVNQQETSKYFFVSAQYHHNEFWKDRLRMLRSCHFEIEDSKILQGLDKVQVEGSESLLFFPRNEVINQAKFFISGGFESLIGKLSKDEKVVILPDPFQRVANLQPESLLALIYANNVRL